MTKLQFRILYREFLFRMMDLELLSAHAQGDMTRLFGQLASLLIWISILFGLAAMGAMGATNSHVAPIAQWMSGLTIEHVLIATTMLAVGLFAVLSWDTNFPDRRDVLVLAPLPVRARTLFFAKVAGVASAMALVVVLLHSAAGLLWPLALFAADTPAAAPQLDYGPAMPPVTPAAMQSVLNRDLAPALQPGVGALAPETGAGLVIGILEHGNRRVFAYGAARPDSIYEIGSISKTFTGLVLARLIVEGRVRLDEPVRELLPPDTVGKPAGREITLLDLATHHSGLPRRPGNLRYVDRQRPEADYHADDLRAYIAKHGVARPDDAGFSYSNLGFVLLGEALANRTGASYAELVRRDITSPLGMHDTEVRLAPRQRARLIPAYGPRHQPIGAWELDAWAPAGGIRSTADDLLTYLDANLHPDKLSAAGSLAPALEQSHQLWADVTPGLRIALPWLYDTRTGVYWHGGATPGYSSRVFFDPAHDCAAVVLLNQPITLLPFSDILSEHVRQRMVGEPAISLASVALPRIHGLAGLLRMYAAYWVAMFAAGLFVFCCVLGIQGVAAQLLPRRLYLRASSWLQLAIFCAVVTGYFLQPAMASSLVMMDAQSPHLPALWPSYWFLGLFQQVNGSPALPALAHRAWMALAIAVAGTALAYVLSYVRTLRQIVEEPDIVPGARRMVWLPRFGDALRTAIVHFSIRTLLRSRQHRVIFVFYLGIGFAITIFLLKSPGTQQGLSASPWQSVNIPMLSSSILMMCAWVLGIRVVFSLPLDIRANWIFRVTPVHGGPECLSARRRALLLLAVAPVWAASAAIFLRLWPWRPAAACLLVLALFGIVVAELCVYGGHKIPFTCSYLPGKSRVHMMLWVCLMVLVQVLNRGAEVVRQAIDNPLTYAALVTALVLTAAAARWRTSDAAKWDEGQLRFEEEDPEAVLTLGLSGGNAGD